MLDVPSITFLSGYLQGYPGTVLVVSHDRAFLNEVATDIVHQHSERLDYYRGANFGISPPCTVKPSSDVSQSRSTPPRKSDGRRPRGNMKTKWPNELIFKVLPHPRDILKALLIYHLAFIDKFRYNAAKSSEAQSRIKKLQKMPVLEPPEAEYTVHFKFPEVEKLSPPIIQMSGVYLQSTSSEVSI